MNTIKFYWNGLKVNGGKIEQYHLSRGGYTAQSGIEESTITIYVSRRNSSLRFSKAVHDFFTIKNDTDSMTDYFESDRINVSKDHPLYSQVLDAYNKQKDHQHKLQNKGNK